MDGVEFKDDEKENYLIEQIQTAQGAPKGLMAWLIEKGVGKNQEEAERFLLGLCIIMLVVSVVLLAVALFPRTPASVPL